MSKDKNEKLFNGITNISDEIIEEAERDIGSAKSKIKKPAKRKRSFIKWGAIAACLCLAIAITPFILHSLQPAVDDMEILKGLNESETFSLSGMEYLIIGNDDIPEHYGFPKEITKSLCGKHAAYLIRDNNGTLTETTKKADIELFEYAKGPCRAAKILRYGNEWHAVIFIGAASDDAAEQSDIKQINFDELYHIYGINSENDIDEIYVCSNKTNAENFSTRNADKIKNFYTETSSLPSYSRDEFEKIIYKNCAADKDRENVDNNIKADYHKLCIKAKNGLIIYTQLYPDERWLRCVTANAYYKINDMTWFLNN